MCHLVIYFSKIYYSGEEGALITFVYIQIERLPLFSLCLCPSLLRARVIVVGGQRLKTTPAHFFRCGLSFFRGSFLRGEGLVGIFLEKYHYPFDLQVGPLLGT